MPAKTPMDKRIFNKLNKMGIVPTPNQKYQIGRVCNRLEDIYNCNQKPNNDLRLIGGVVKLVSAGVETAYVERLKRNFKLKRGVTPYSLMIRHGKKRALEMWEEYRQKQSSTNTFEYKNKKYGMTKEEFEEYNKTRAATKANFIKRHGTEHGSRLWSEYRERQSYAGVKLEYFIEKHGDVKGRQIYDDLRLKKSHTIEGIMARTGCSYDSAVEKLEELAKNMTSTNYYSDISQDLFWKIYNQLPVELKEKCYFGENQGEYGTFSKHHGKYLKYDFVISNLKFCIEFNGDWYHANPKKYRPTDTLKIHGTEIQANEIWIRDQEKNMVLEDQGFRVIVVWQSDYSSDKENIVNRCLHEIEKTYRLHH